MLIDKGASVGEVVTIKLLSGEEIIGKLVEDTDAYVKLSKPRVLTSTSGGIGLAPYLFTVDESRDVKLYKPIVVMEPIQFHH